MTRSSLGRDRYGYFGKPTAVVVALRAACSGIETQENTHAREASFPRPKPTPTLLEAFGTPLWLRAGPLLHCSHCLSARLRSSSLQAVVAQTAVVGSTCPLVWPWPASPHTRTLYQLHRDAKTAKYCTSGSCVSSELFLCHHAIGGPESHAHPYTFTSSHFKSICFEGLELMIKLSCTITVFLAIDTRVLSTHCICKLMLYSRLELAQVSRPSCPLLTYSVGLNLA